MGTLKKFAKYIIWIALFWIFTDILIFFGLNANYDKLTTSNNSNIPSQIEIEQAEATLVNGRIRGKIKNDGEEDINGKYMKVDLYSTRDVLLGTKYMEISDLEKGASDDFELFFKAQDVDHYDITFIDKIIKSNEQINLQDVFIGKDMGLYERLRELLGALLVFDSILFFSPIL